LPVVYPVEYPLEYPVWVVLIFFELSKSY
jgi:hypothetical protein